jgi:hypothetical protein
VLLGLSKPNDGTTQGERETEIELDLTSGPEEVDFGDSASSQGDTGMTITHEDFNSDQDKPGDADNSDDGDDDDDDDDNDDDDDDDDDDDNSTVQQEMEQTARLCVSLYSLTADPAAVQPSSGSASSPPPSSQRSKTYSGRSRKSNSSNSNNDTKDKDSMNISRKADISPPMRLEIGGRFLACSAIGSREGPVPYFLAAFSPVSSSPSSSSSSSSSSSTTGTTPASVEPHIPFPRPPQQDVMEVVGLLGHLLGESLRKERHTALLECAGELLFFLSFPFLSFPFLSFPPDFSGYLLLYYSTSPCISLPSYLPIFLSFFLCFCLSLLPFSMNKTCASTSTRSPTNYP